MAGAGDGGDSQGGEGGFAGQDGQYGGSLQGGAGSPVFPETTEMPHPDSTWTPQCVRQGVSGEMPWGNCCKDVDCYIPEQPGQCHTIKDALLLDLVSLWIAQNAGTCACSDKPTGLSGPYLVPEDYPKYPPTAPTKHSALIKPGMCCYIASYHYCLGRPLRIMAQVRLAELREDPRWG